VTSAPSNVASSAAPPLPDRLLDAGVLAFATFTLLANLATFFGGSLRQLTWAAGLAALAALGTLLWRIGRHRLTTAPPPAHLEPSRRVEAGEPAPVRLRIVVLAAAVGDVALLALTGNLWAFSAIGLLLTGGLLVRELAQTPRLSGRPPSARQLCVLLAFSGLCVAAVMAAHSSDADDSFYVNQVVTAVDHPDAAILRYDGLHGIPEVPLQLPVLAVLSFEPLEAVLSRTLGLPALSVAHLVMPALAAFLLPFAYARLLRRLLPDRWLIGVALGLAWLVCVGDGEGGYGDFALLRLQQGKSIMLHLALPLVLCHGIELAQAPGWRGLVRLAAAQVCAVGLSSTALWLAPGTAALGLATGLVLTPAAGGGRPGLRALGWGLAGCAYPVGLALGLRSATLRVFAEAAHPLPSTTWSGEELVAGARSMVLGDGNAGLFALVTLLAAWAAAESHVARRFCVVCGFAFLLFWNPLSAAFVAHQVTGADAYFRVFWLLPLPALVAVLLTGPFAAGRRARWPAIALAAGLLLALPAVYTLSRANDVELRWPGYKLPPVYLSAAREIAAHAGSGDLVLAGSDVSLWIPLLHGHPAPLMVREILLDVLRPRLGGEELERRVLLTRMVGGELRPVAGGKLLTAAIADYPLAAVCLSGRALSYAELRAALLASPLRVVRKQPEFEVWARSD
jgi:hypothetical protein